jgi:hypothetical protein
VKYVFWPDEDEDMDRPERLTVKGSLWKPALWVAGGSAGVVGGLLLLVGRAIVVWVVAGVLASVSAGVLVLAALPVPKDLALTPEGLEVGRFYKKAFYGWQDVEGFRVISQGKVKRVGFNLVAGRGRVTGRDYDDALADIYERTPEELAELVNDWKHRYGR